MEGVTRSRSSTAARPIALAAALALASVAIAAGATPADHAVTFEASPKSPVKVSDNPVGLFADDLIDGDGLDDLVIADADDRRLSVYRSATGSFKQVLGAPTPPGPVTVAGDPQGNFFVPGKGEGWLYRFALWSGRDSLKAVQRVPLEGDPTAATFTGFLFGDLDDTGRSLGEGLTVTDRASDTLRIFNFDRGRVSELPAIPVGDAPSAVASAGFGRPVVVANSGSDSVTLLPIYVGVGVSNGDGPITPFTAPNATEYPVGDDPEAIALGNLDATDVDDDEIVVANAGSRSLTILNSPDDAYDFATVATIPLPGTPTSLAITKLDDRKGRDVAVTLADGRLVVYSGDNRGGLERSGIYRTGLHPEALVALTANRYFGPDLAVLNNRSGDVSVLLRHEPGTCNGRPAKIVTGTPGDDGLRGSPGPDQVSGLDGDDSVYSGGAPDCVDAGPGSDFVDGSGGDDRISGGAGDDDILGAPGDDRISGGPGDDRLFSDASTLFGPGIDGLAGRDTVNGGPGDDRIVAGPARDRVNGGPGDDRVDVYDSYPDQVECGPGRDVAVGTSRDNFRNCEVVRR